MQPRKTGVRILHAAAVIAVLLVAAMLRLLPDPPPVDGLSMFHVAVIGVEVLVVLLALLVVFPRVALLDAFLVAVALAILRATMAGLAVVLAGERPELGSGGLGPAWLSLWVGQLEFVALQVVLTVLVALPFLAAHVPRLMGITAAPAGAAAAPATTSQAMRMLASAEGHALVGGILNFNDYASLAEFIGRTPSLLGFALSSDEGLLVLSDGQRLPFPLEAVAPHLQIGFAELQRQQERCGMTTTDCWQYSPDFTLVYVPLRPCFYLALLYRPDVAAGDIAPRVEIIRRSAEAFLVDRHKAQKGRAREAA